MRTIGRGAILALITALLTLGVFPQAVVWGNGQPTLALAANNSVSASVAIVGTGETATLTAAGDRQGEAGAELGDERYVPTGWTSTEPDQTGTFTFGNGVYTSAYKPAAGGAYTVTATFQKQSWDGSVWSDVSGSTDTKTTTVTAKTGQWITVGNAGFTGNGATVPSIVVDNGTPYLAYRDGSHSGKITVQKYVGNTWTTVGDAGFSQGALESSQTAVALAVYGGTPYVAYIESYNITVKMYDGSSWVVLGPSDQAGVPKSVGLAENSLYMAFAVYNGTPYLAFEDLNQQKMRVKKYAGGTWTEVAESGKVGISDTQGNRPSISVYNGTPYLADNAYGTGSSVMKFNGSAWEYVGATGLGIPNGVSLGFDSAGTPYLAHSDFSTQNVRLVKYSGTAWEYVGNQSLVEGTTTPRSLVFVNDVPYVGYSHKTNTSTAGVMKYEGNQWTALDSANFAPGGVSTVTVAAYSNILYTAYIDMTLSSAITVKKYVILPPTADAASNSVAASPGEARIGGPIALTATGDRQAEAGLSNGEEKYVPVSWTSTEPNKSGTFVKNGSDYTAEYVPAANGSYTVTATFQKQRWNGSAWADVTGATDTKTTPVEITARLWSIVGTAGFAWSGANAVALAVYGDTPYIAYPDATAANKATVLKYEAGEWTSVGDRGFSGAAVASVSIAVYEGIPYALYSDSGQSNKATLMKYEGGTWSAVGNPGFSAGEAGEPKLVVNNGTPYVIYKDGSSGYKATVMKYDGGNGWVNAGDDGFSDGAASDPALFVYEGTPYVAYKDDAHSNRATVKKLGQGGWEDVGSEGFSNGAISSPSLIVLGGIPYVAFSDGDQGNKATVMKYDGGSWTTVGQAGFSAGQAANVSLVSLNGALYASYKDGANGNAATLMKLNGNAWTTVGQAGFSAGIAANSAMAAGNVNLYVVFNDGTSNDAATVMRYGLPAPTTAKAANNSVNATPVQVTSGSAVTLTAIGDRQSASGEVSGDERYVPTSWTSTEPDQSGAFTLTGSDYTAAYTPVAAGALTVTATFQKQVWNGSVWSDANGATDTKSVPVTVLAVPPGAPTNVTAVAGDGQATVSFTAPVHTGGSPITSYVVTASPGAIAGSGFSPVTITGLTNGVSYTFTVQAFNTAGGGIVSDASSAVMPSVPESDSESESGAGPVSAPENTSGSTGNAGNAPAAQVELLVNGRLERINTVTTTTERGGQSVTVVALDQQQLEDKLAAENVGAIVTIPLNSGSQVVIGELNGQMLKGMEDKRAVLKVQTERATYTLPAQQINIAAIAGQLGQSVALKDIKVQIEIAQPTAQMAQVVDRAAQQGEFELVVPPVSFTVRAVYGDTTIDVTTFDAYVERTIAIPDGVNPSRVTTAVVVEPDGTVRHVPTKVVVANGKYYAQINSLTNSTYSLISHLRKFADVEAHWSQQAVNDMGSRMVIEGGADGAFHPDDAITRAEFTAIVVRGLGLKPKEAIGATFTDIAAEDWYNGVVNAAHAYGLIDGFEDGAFRPNDRITREQAMAIVAKAMRLTGLKGETAAGDTLGSYADAGDVSEWAKNGVNDNLQAGIVSGRSDTLLAPKASVTRAEVAAMVQKLLQKSGLIG